MIPPETTCRVGTDMVAVLVAVVREPALIAGLVGSLVDEVDEVCALVGALVLLVGLVVLVKVVGGGSDITVVALTFEG